MEALESTHLVLVAASLVGQSIPFWYPHATNDRQMLGIYCRLYDRQTKDAKGKCSPSSDGVGIVAHLHLERGDPATGYRVHDMCAVLPRLCHIFWK